MSASVRSSWKHTVLLLVPLLLFGILFPERPALDEEAPALFQAIPQFGLVLLAGLLIVATGRLFRRPGYIAKIQALVLWVVFTFLFVQTAFWAGLYIHVYRQHRTREVNRRTFYMDRQQP